MLERGLAGLLEDVISAYGYLGVFLLVFLLNIAPAMAPPTWVFLSTIYFLFPTLFSPLPLAFVGTCASTLGRVALSYFGRASRRLMGGERIRSLDRIGRVIGSRMLGAFLLSLVFALGPLPSNVYFLLIGMTQAQYPAVFIGFWLGRLISYWLLVSLSMVAFRSLADALSNELYAVLVVDSLAIASMLLFAFIDWNTLIEERRIVVIKPTLRRKR